MGFVGRVEEIIYYQTEKGLVAVSLDEGVTIILPTGKHMPPTDAWEEVSEDLAALLSPKQKEFLDAARNKPPMSELEEIAWKHRNRTLHDRRNYVKPKDAPREVREDVLVVKSDLED